MTSASDDSEPDLAARILRSRPDLAWLAEQIGDSEPLDVGAPLREGQRLRVYGGYDEPAAWLANNPDGCWGTLVAFIPGQNKLASAVVELDKELQVGGAVGRYVVLEQGWVGVPWGQTSPRVHVELCDFFPDSKPWSERRQGAWVESHAAFEAVDA
jgi:hypothetical protein